MNQRKHEYNKNNLTFLQRFIQSSNKRTRKIAFFLAVVFFSGLIWLAGWLIELIVVGLYKGAAWVINLL